MNLQTKLSNYKMQIPSLKTKGASGVFLEKNLIAVFLLSLLTLGINLRWILLYRSSGLLDIDESCYFFLSLLDYMQFVDGGVVSWFKQVVFPSIQSPITTALASVAFVLVKPGITMAIVIPILMGSGVIVATYYLGRAVFSANVGLAASFLVACCPVIINYSRSFHFAITATLVTTLTLCALASSRELLSWRRCVIFGVGLGLMPLARTMTIAFIPGILLGAALIIPLSQDHKIKRSLHLLLSIVVAVGVASIWLGPNHKLVFDYLFQAGYGERAKEYGEMISPWSGRAFLITTGWIISQIYLPHALLLLAAVVVSVVVLARKASQVHEGVRGELLRILRENARLLPIILFLIAGLMALHSSPNKGTAFAAPLVPAAMVLCSSVLLGISGARSGSILPRLLVGLFFILAMLPFIGLHNPFSSERKLTLPWVGAVTVADGRGTIQQYFAACGLANSSEPEAMNPLEQEQWNQLIFQICQTIDLNNVSPVKGVAFGFRHHLLNWDSVLATYQLEMDILANRRTPLFVQVVDPIAMTDSVECYERWLKKKSAAGFLLMTSDHPGTFKPLVNPEFMRDAALRSGYHPIQSWEAPDHQKITLWKCSLP